LLLRFISHKIHLLFIVQWDLSWEEAQRLGQDASKNFKDLDPQIVDLAIQVHPLSS
jgi:divalent metal cation (Fe/Co/Zn/Cd) transporter